MHGIMPEQTLNTIMLLYWTSGIPVRYRYQGIYVQLIQIIPHRSDIKGCHWKLVIVDVEPVLWESTVEMGM